MASIDQLQTRLRHERDLSKISGTLQDVAAARFDLVASQSALSMNDACDTVTIANPTGEPIITEDGVHDPTINAAFTRTAERQIAERLRIPVKYLDRLTGSAAHPSTSASDETGPRHRRLAAHSINELAATDDRMALYRMLQADDGAVLRSVLSDSYGLFDNDRAIKALIEGLESSNLGFGHCDVEGDVTPDKLRLRIHVPAIELAVPDLLGDYRMPFSMREDQPAHARPVDGETPPVIWAGLEIGNSETGHGTFYVAPRAVIGVCRNGLVRPVEFKRAHIGGRLSEGEIEWSGETRQNVYSLVASQVADVVKTYLSVGYLETLADEMRHAKGVKVESPAKAIEVVTDKLGLTEAESRNVFDCFARGGDQTAFGVANAVTAAAQLVDDGDRQAEMEAGFWTVVDSPQLYARV